MTTFDENYQPVNQDERDDLPRPEVALGPNNADATIHIRVAAPRPATTTVQYGDRRADLFSESCTCGALDPKLAVYSSCGELVGCNVCIPELRPRPPSQRHAERRRVHDVAPSSSGDGIALACDGLAVDAQLSASDARRLLGLEAKLSSRFRDALVGMEVTINVETIGGEVASCALDVAALAKERSVQSEKVKATHADICMCGASVERKSECLRDTCLGRVVSCPSCRTDLTEEVPWETGRKLERVSRTESGLAAVVGGETFVVNFLPGARYSLGARVLAILGNYRPEFVADGWSERLTTDGDEVSENKRLDTLVGRLSEVYVGKVDAPSSIDQATSSFKAEIPKGKAVSSRFAGRCACGERCSVGGSIRFHSLGIVACAKCEPRLALEVALSTSQQSVDGLKVPIGYEIWADGIFRCEFPRNDGASYEYSPPPSNAIELPAPPERYGFLKRIAARAIWIAGTSVPLDDQTAQQLRLVFLDDAGRRAIRSVPRDLIARLRTLVDLSAYGYPVHDLNAKDLLVYLAKWLEENGDRKSVV